MNNENDRSIKKTAADIARVNEEILGLEAQIAEFEKINDDGQYDKILADLYNELKGLYRYLYAN